LRHHSFHLVFSIYYQLLGIANSTNFMKKSG
jgi:hypothetical protein